MTLDTLFQNQHALPSAPKVVEDLISSFDNPEVSNEEIANRLSTDPVLSAKLLRLANSAHFHASRSISTINVAVMMLGFVTVRTLVISSGLANAFKTVPGLDLKQFWRYNLHTAVAAKWIARQCGENTDLAFIVGIMHAIGQLVMHAAVPEQAIALDKLAGPFDAGRFAVEEAEFGFSHADVGAELAARWKFPAVFADAIRTFPHPLGQTPPDRMAAVIHLAAWRARSAEDGLDEAALAASYPVEVAHSLGLAPNALIAAMPALSELSAGLDELVH